MRIGVDIGGTKIGFGLLDEHGSVLFFKKEETEKERGYGYIIEKIKSSILDMLRTNGLTTKDIERIGVACAGQVDIVRRIVMFSPNLRWKDAPVGPDLESFFSVRTIVENDVNAATYAEWKFSFREEPKNTVGLFLGTGVGGGIIVDGKLYRGKESVAGEIGHMILNPYGYLCNCGTRGCLEAFCGGDYIIRRVKDLLERGYRGKIWELTKEGEEIYVSHVEKAYYLGDEAMERIWEEVIEYLGCGLTSIVNIFNPDLVVLGGGVILGTERLLSEAKTVVQKKAMPESKKHLRIEKARLGDFSAIMGAAFLYD